MKSEEWKYVVGYEGLYYVSNKGGLRCPDKQVLNFRGGNPVYSNRKGRILKPTVSKCGYLYTTFSYNKERKTLYVHRLVAEAFIPNPNNLPQVNHIDGNKLNNSLENLEWCTASENRIHAIKKGLVKGKRGESSHYSKLSKKEINLIRNLYFEECLTQITIANKFNISQAQVSRIVRGVNWF